MSEQPRDRDIAEEWPIQAFLDQFDWVEKKMEGRKFAFILGAGASVSSGIPTGGQLVDRWLRELHARDLNADARPIEEWATNKTLGIREYDRDFKYDNRAEYYPQIYDKRFGEDPPEGYRYLESVMEKARPGVGYSMLAQILSKSRHKVVITTNFDNLVADAVLMYTNTFAQVCGHEALTSFIDVDPQRPLVAKIHRDLLLAPQNDPYRTNVLHESWAAALRNLFAVYTPIVIGYGGNDGSLMNFLFTLHPGSIPGGIFWCYKLGGPRPDARIQELIKRQSGKMLGIPGFDEFMFLVGRQLECQTQEKWIVTDATARAKTYESQLGEVLRQLGEDAKRPDRKELVEQVQSAIQSAVPEADQEVSWIAWELKARGEPDPKKREQIYRKGIQILPHSSKLRLSFARFLRDDIRDYDQAEILYRKAKELDPESVMAISHLAIFLEQVRCKYDEAEKLYRKAKELDPESTVTIGNLAMFLDHVRNDSDEAENLHRRSLELHPENSRPMVNYAHFLHYVRSDKDEAERLLLKAMELNPGDAYTVESYALFLHEARGDHTKPNELYQRAMALDPAQPSAYVNFTKFLIERGNLEAASEMSDRAWALVVGGAPSTTVTTAMYRGLLMRLANKDDTPAIGRLHGLFGRKFSRGRRSYANVFTAVDERLSEEDRKLYHAIAGAILDKDKVVALDEFPRWKKVEPIPLDKPWPPLAEQD